jgi:hypothetical protein
MRDVACDHRAGLGCVDAGIVWQPPIGDRVRIRPDINGRCPDGAHDWHERGHTGIVVNVRGACGDSSHPYLVVFDAPHPVMHLSERAVELPARHYAAEELEPISSYGVRVLPEIRMHA